MWAVVLGSFLGFLTLGKLTPLPNTILYGVVICLLLLLALQYGFSARYKSKSSFFLNTILCILAVMLSGSYANTQLHTHLQTNHFISKELTTLVKVVGISQSIDEKVRQVVTPVQPIEGLPQKWLLKSAYSSNSHQQMNQMRSGQVWQITARVHPPYGVASKGLFSEQKWLLGMQVGAVALATDVVPVQHTVENSTTKNQSYSIFSKDGLANYRLSLRHKLNTLSDKPKYAQDKAVLLALLTGDTALISTNTKQLYKQTGISHLLAISGPHVLFAAGLFAWLLVKLLNKFARVYHYFARLHVVMPFALIVAVGYALLAGWELPAQRTVWMFAIATVLVFIKIRFYFWQIMLLSATIILWIEPLAVLSAAFWLSFVAVGLLVMLEQGMHIPNVIKYKNFVGMHYRFAKTSNKVFKFIYIQWLFFIGILPISMVFFGEVSWLAPLTNLFAIPLLGFVVVPFNIGAYLLSFVHDGLANGLWHMLLMLVHGFHNILAWLVEYVPNSLLQVTLDKISLWAFAIAFAVLFVPLFKQMRWLALPLGLLIFLPKQLPAPAVVTVLDGTNFSAVLVQTKVDSGLFPVKNLLYISDFRYGSSNKRYFNEYEIEHNLKPSLHALGVFDLDVLMLSSQVNSSQAQAKKLEVKSNHFEGTLAFINSLNSDITIKKVYTNDLVPTKNSNNQADLNTTLKKNALKHIDINKCDATKNWQWGGVMFDVLSPWQDVPLVGDDGACVLKINLIETDSSSKLNSAVLLGNASQLNQKMLMALCTDLSADVLMLAKQGSKSAYYEPIIETANPNYVFVGKKFSGFNTSKQHPHLMVTAELLNKQKVIHTTHQKGSLQYYLGSSKTDVKWYRQKYPWLATEK